MKIVKKLFAFGILSSLAYQSVWAQASSFMIETTPANPVPNEAADLSVKALDDKGDIISNFDGSIIMTLEQGGKSVSKDDYTLPEDGIYEYTTSDKGVASFKKGLVIRKAGTYTLKVEGVDGGSKSIDLNVADKSSVVTGNVTVTTPTKDSTIKNDSIEISGTSDFDNSPIDIFINDQKVLQATSDKNGDFSANTSLLNYQKGTISIQAKVRDLQDNYVAMSTPININYDLSQNWVKSLTYNPNAPSTTDAVSFELKTEDTVNSATLVLSGGKEIILSKKDMGLFVSNTIIDTPGTYSISAKLGAESGVKTFDNIGTISVTQAVVSSSSVSSSTSSSSSSISSSSEISSSSSSEVSSSSSSVEKGTITNVKAIRDSKTSDIALDWTYTQDAQSFVVQYGTSDALGSQAISQTNSFNIKNVDPNSIYYVKITGVFNGYTSESQTIQVDPIHSAASCQIAGIKLNSIQQNGKYYLTWDAAPGAKEYSIYTSDTPNASLNQMSILSKTSDTKFEYSYNPNAKQEQYKYYAVVANCEDGTVAQIDNVKKVKVGPLDTAVLMLFITGFVYGVTRIARKI